MNNQTIIRILSEKLIKKIKNLIACGMTKEQAYANAKENGIAGPAVWEIVDLEMSQTGLYCGLSDDCFAVFTNVAF